MQTLQGLVPFDSAWWGEVSAGDVQVAPRNWLHGSMGLSRSFAEEWNALAEVDLFGLQSMQQLGVVIRERDVVGPLPENPEVAAFSLRHGLYHCMALTTELPHSGLMFFVSIYRPPTRPDFSDGESVLFGEFVLHPLQQWHHRLQRLQSDTPGRPWDRFALARPSGELLFAGLRISGALGEASPGWHGTHPPAAGGGAGAGGRALHPVGGQGLPLAAGALRATGGREPAIAQQAHQVNLGPTVLRHIFKSRDNWMSPAKIALYAKAEVASCDGLDGLKDGIIGNIEACNYVPTDLLCQGADNDRCLTAGQIGAIRLIYSDHKTPVTLSRGAVGYPRYGRCGPSTSDWQSYMFGTSFDAPDSFNHMAVTEAARLVEGNPNANILTHDLTQYQAQYSRLAEMIDGTDPDIAAFADNGGKLLIWNGLGDTCVSLYRTADYFDTVKQRLGASKVQGFARMVTSPSKGHDLDGAGTEPRSIDLLAAMDAWVEKGAAPDKLVATKFAPGTSTPVAQRPVCEYPQFPRYNGTGDPAKAESFTCSAT